MKKVLGGILVLMLAAAPLFADANTVSKENLELAKKGLMFSLKSENAGVRNSALHILAKVRADHPNANLSGFNRVLTDMSKKDDMKAIRANANLAYIYINSNELPARVRVEDREDPSIFFNDLYTELSENFVALNR